MAISLLNITPVPLQIGGGVALRGSQVADCTPLKTPPACVSISVNWATYGASSIKSVLIDVDLNIMAASNPLDKIRSIYIDNTFSPSPVYAFFQDTQFAVVCPPYSVVMGPVWTNALKVQLFANAFDDLNIPKTTYQLSNLHVPLYSVIPSNDLVVTKNIFVTDTRTAPTSGNGTSTHTYTNVNMGVSSSKGLQFAGIHLNGFVTVNNVQFNGVNGTLIVQQGTGASGDSVALFRAPSNLSGLTNVTVAAILSGNVTGGNLELFSTYNLANSGNASATRIGTGGSGSSTAKNLSTATDGLAIMISADNVAGGAAISGIANVFEASPSGGLISAGYGYQKTIGLTLSLSCAAAGAGNAWVAASFF